MKYCVTVSLISILAMSSGWAGNHTGKPVGQINADGTVGLVRSAKNAFKRANALAPNLFSAKGKHQCWADNEAGRWCNVEGMNFTDCQEAYYRLKQDDCCRRNSIRVFGQSFNSRSVDFKITKCSGQRI